MKRNCWILVFFIVGSVLFLQTGCAEQIGPTDKAKPVVDQPKAAAKSEPNESVPKTEGPRPAKITFAKTVHDFGSIGPKTKNTCKFEFTNAGGEILKIKKIHAPCGCTVPTLTKKEYAPGESGSIKVTFSSSRRQGKTVKYIYVHSNDKKNPKAKLAVKGTVKVRVAHEPKKLNLSLRQENAGCPKIMITSLDNRPFAIKRFKSTADCITADVNSSVEAAEFVLEPKVNMDKLKKTLNGKVEIKLTHPQCRAVSIPFKTLPEFSIDPPSISVVGAKPQEPVEREVWILSNYDEDFEVESVSSKKGIIKILGQEKVGNRYKFKLEITPPAVKAKKRIFTDVLFVNVKGGEKLQVTCRGFYAK